MSVGASGGETNLRQLLASASARRHDAVTYAFVTLPPSHADTPALLSALVAAAVVVVKEAEGVTLVVPKASLAALPAELPVAAAYECAWLTLEVHSALEAVGLTAAFAAELTRQGISANVVAGFYHDHLFVAEADAERAVDAINGLSSSVASELAA